MFDRILGKLSPKSHSAEEAFVRQCFRHVAAADPALRGDSKEWGVHYTPLHRALEPLGYQTDDTARTQGGAWLLTEFHGPSALDETRQIQVVFHRESGELRYLLSVSPQERPPVFREDVHLHAWDISQLPASLKPDDAFSACAQWLEAVGERENRFQEQSRTEPPSSVRFSS